MNQQITIELPKVSLSERALWASEPRSKPGLCLANARYDAGGRVFVLEMGTGAVLLVTPHQLQGLENATPEQLGSVEICGGGLALRWPALSVRITMNELLEMEFGFVTVNENARRAGSKKSDAKAAASRINGEKGGRPRRAARK